jgi:hydrogenase maturation factor
MSAPAWEATPRVHPVTGDLHFGAGAARVSVPGMSAERAIRLEADVLGENNRIAASNRAHFASHGIRAFNLVSSPGSGKTTLLCATIAALRVRAPALPLGVIEGDQQTSHDADRIRATGVPAIQVNTGRGCHLDAPMVAEAFARLPLHAAGVHAHGQRRDHGQDRAHGRAHDHAHDHVHDPSHRHVHDDPPRLRRLRRRAAFRPRLPRRARPQAVRVRRHPAWREAARRLQAVRHRLHTREPDGLVHGVLRRRLRGALLVRALPRHPGGGRGLNQPGPGPDAAPTMKKPDYVRPLDLKHGRVDMNHGAGGRASAQLVEQLFARAFDNPALRQGNDGALLDVPPGHRLVMPVGREIGGARARPGDVVLLSGPVGDHGVAILSLRESLAFETTIESDTAALHGLVAALLAAVPEGAVRTLRDPTRGGLATTLNEIARQSAVGTHLDEAAIPVRPQVAAACELLGLDPLYIANEGKLVAVAAPEHAEAVLAAMRAHPLGREAARIGTVNEDPHRFVQMATRFGGQRVVDWLSGEPLPRIC